MADIIFVHTEHDYGYTYADFWLLVALAGYKKCALSEIDPESDNTYIVTPLNEEWSAGWKSPRARIILWDLEWHLPQLSIPEGVSEVWASDKWYAQAIGAKYVVLGSDARFSQNQKAPIHNAQYDYALMMYTDPYRRSNLLIQGVQNHQLRFAPNGWTDVRHNALLASQAVLHIHQWDDVQTISPLRFAFASAYGLPIVTERLADAGVFADVVLQADYNELMPYARALHTERDMLKFRGNLLHDLLCVQHPFKQCVENAL